MHDLERVICFLYVTWLLQEKNILVSICHGRKIWKEMEKESSQKLHELTTDVNSQ